MAEEDTSPVPPLAEEPATPPQEAPAPEVAASEPMEQASAPVDGQVIETPTQTAQPQAQTAQMGRSEPLPVESEPLPPEPLGQATKSADSVQDTKPADSPAPAQSSSPISTTVQHLGRDVLVKARAVIQDRKKKKLEKIMAELEKNGKITNDEVEKLLHVSDATATRYLSALEKEGKIKQVGKTGKSVVYTRN